MHAVEEETDGRLAMLQPVFQAFNSKHIKSSGTETEIIFEPNKPSSLVSGAVLQSNTSSDISVKTLNFSSDMSHLSFPKQVETGSSKGPSDAELIDGIMAAIKQNNFTAKSIRL